MGWVVEKLTIWLSIKFVAVLICIWHIVTAHIQLQQSQLGSATDWPTLDSNPFQYNAPPDNIGDPFQWFWHIEMNRWWLLFQPFGSVYWRWSIGWWVGGLIVVRVELFTIHCNCNKFHVKNNIKNNWIARPHLCCCRPLQYWEIEHFNVLRNFWLLIFTIWIHITTATSRDSQNNLIDFDS